MCANCNLHFRQGKSHLQHTLDVILTLQWNSSKFLHWLRQDGTGTSPASLERVPLSLATLCWAPAMSPLAGTLGHTDTQLLLTPAPMLRTLDSGGGGRWWLVSPYTLSPVSTQETQERRITWVVFVFKRPLPWSNFVNSLQLFTSAK